MKKVLSLLLLLIFFAGQANLVWAEHFCGDQLIESKITIQTDPHSCCGDSQTIPEDCCQDEITQIQSDDFYSKSELKAQISPEFLLLYSFVIGAIEIRHDHVRPFTDFQSRIPVPDLHLLHQTFLI